MAKGTVLSIGSWVVVGVILSFPLFACGNGEEASVPGREAAPVSNPLSVEAQDLVNRGNSAQRDGRYAAALEAFGQALDLHPDHPVPQFGSLMAAMALGDTALAQTLRRKLETTGPELLDMLGAGGVMGSGPSVAPHAPEGGIPPGHPTVDLEANDTLLPTGGISG